MYFLSVSVYKNIETGYFHPTKQIGSAHTCKRNTVFDFTIPDFPRRKKPLQLFVRIAYSLLG